MKHGLTLFVGLFAGMALALALLFVNPLTGRSDPELGAFDSVFRYGFPDDGVVLVTHSGALPLPIKPDDVPELWENTVRSVAVTVAALSQGDAAMPKAVVSKIAMLSRQTELLTNGIIVNDYSLFSVPGEGSFFVVGDSNVWPIIRENVVPVSLLNRPWRGPRSYRATEGPGVSGTALAIGATGLFSGREGSAAEVFHLQDYSREGGFESVAADLHLHFIGPPTAEDP